MLTAYIRPKLEYASPAWSPTLRHNHTERVGRRATNLVPDIREQRRNEGRALMAATLEEARKGET